MRCRNCKTHHKTGGPFTRPVPKPNLSCSEERWLPTPSDQPQTLESPPSGAGIQDGGSEDDLELDPEEGLDGHNKPKGHLFVSASGPGASPVPQVCLERQPVRSHQGFNCRYLASQQLCYTGYGSGHDEWKNREELETLNAGGHELGLYLLYNFCEELLTYQEHIKYKKRPQC